MGSGDNSEMASDDEVRIEPFEKRSWDIKLAWSEYREGRWSAKMVGTDVVHVESVSFTDDLLFEEGTKAFIFAPSSTSFIHTLNFTPGPLALWVLGKRTQDEVAELGYFDFPSCDNAPHLLKTPFLAGRNLVRPPGSRHEWMRFAEGSEYDTDEPNPLTLPVPDVDFPGLPSGSPLPVLAPPERFVVPHSHQFDQFLSQAPFFYEDARRVFLVEPYDIPLSEFLSLFPGGEWGMFIALLIGLSPTTPIKLYRFRGSYHPYVCEFITEIKRYGIAGLLDPASNSQLRLQKKWDPFFGEYNPSDYVDRRHPIGEIEFSHEGAYSLYNWELFFHAPLLIADRLMQNQRFAEAQKWFHFIFNPILPVGSEEGGLIGAYFDDRNRLRPVVVRIDSRVSFDWRREMPDQALQPGPFRVRWTGRLTLRPPGIFGLAGPIFDVWFTLRSGGAVRFWLGGDLLIDRRAPGEYRTMARLTMGVPVATILEVDFFTPGSQATVTLMWDVPWSGAVTIPSDSLDPGLLPYWRVRPFWLNTDAHLQVGDLLREIAGGDAELNRQVEQWRNDPFNPHLIARRRLVAYQKTVVMKYIDNLIAWGDQLFRQDTMESTNEAAQLYLLAAEILGPRPLTVPSRAELPVKTSAELLPAGENGGGFYDPMVEIEELLTSDGELPAGSDPSGARAPVLSPFYFCIPKNDKLLGYWDTVADRLFKLRHCMNIEGVVRQLPLYEPPIDPGLLVRARALGVDLASAISGLNAPLPHYRFQFMLQKAVEFCSFVQTLGSTLLAALEKRDGEALGMLRARHESSLLAKMTQIRRDQIREAEETKAGLEAAKELAKKQLDYYSSRQFMNYEESANIDDLGDAHDKAQAAQLSSALAAILFAVPQFHAGLTVGTEIGGVHLGNVAKATAEVFTYLAERDRFDASMHSLQADYRRRMDDWMFQADLARSEESQAQKQVLAADIRRAIAEQELKNHEQQIENAKAVEDFLRYKFTNQELYDWQVSQTTSLHYQAYRMAFDLAQRAESTFQHEIGNRDTKFINFGYWDSLKKGLLAGERLHFDLKRMEMAYLDQNKREYELTKSVSLDMLDPIALINLKETGECFLNLPEEIFDLDYPGHYFRRIKSISLTIPCVTGPFTSVNCTLTLLGNRLRKDPNPGASYRYEGLEDPRFQHNIGAIQSIATSSAQNDPGMFELNFRDERFLPFEGAGAISEWRLELSGKWRLESGELVTLNQFDFDTISDVILQLRYTGREGGNRLKEAAVKALQEAVNEMVLANEQRGLFRLFSLRHDFPNAFHRLLHPNPPDARQTAEFELKQQHFPYFLADRALSLSVVKVYLKPKGTEAVNTASLRLTVNSSEVGTWTNFPGSDPILLEGEAALTGNPLGLWTIDAGTNGLSSEELDDILILLNYTASPPDRMLRE